MSTKGYRYPKPWLDAYQQRVRDGLTHKKIAGEFGITLAALQKRLKNARRANDPRAVYTSRGLAALADIEQKRRVTQR